MRVLVTGGAGFVGSHLVEALLARGDQVVVLDDLATGSEKNLPAGTDLRRVDVSDVGALAQALSDVHVDAVVHAAAEARITVTVADPERSERVNVGGTRNTLSLARRAGARRFVFISTGGAMYGETATCATEEHAAAPISPYGRDKLAAERLVATSGLPYAILRLANVYGPRQRGDLEAGVIAIFLARWHEGRELVVFGDGTAQRDWVWAGDVARAVLAALGREGDGLWNIGTGAATSVNGLIEILRRRLGEPPGGVRYAPAREGELMRSCLDPSRAGHDGLWRPSVSLDEGIGTLVKSV